MYCTHCGKKIPNDSKFCPFCGVEQKILGWDTNNDKNEKYKNGRPVVIEIHKALQNVDRTKNIVRKLLKELSIILLFSAIALAFNMLFQFFFIFANKPPIVSDEQQEAYNNNPAVLSSAPHGIALANLGVGEWKYDTDIVSEGQLSNLNLTRNSILKGYAQQYATIFSGILLGLLILYRYGKKLIRWLK
jgi:hypothetical protein